MIFLLSLALSPRAHAEGCKNDLYQDLNCNTVEVYDEEAVDLTY